MLAVRGDDNAELHLGQPAGATYRVRWVDIDAIPANFVDTTASALHRYLTNGPQVSLDGWTGDLLEVRLWDGKGGVIASESLYEDDE